MMSRPRHLFGLSRLLLLSATTELRLTAGIGPADQGGRHCGYRAYFAFSAILLAVPGGQALDPGNGAGR